MKDPDGVLEKEAWGLRSDGPELESSVFHLGLTWEAIYRLHFYATDDKTKVKKVVS